jgi:CopG family nickel-responsive transcriptional regulator
VCEVLRRRYGAIHHFPRRKAGDGIRRLIRERGYDNRSEAVRDILREKLETSRLDHEEAPHCIAALSYIYNHHQRDLAERLTALPSIEHHDLTLAAMHAHLDHDNCIETVILRGPTKAVREFAHAHAGRARRAPRRSSTWYPPTSGTPPHQHQHGHHHGPDHPYHVHSRPKS